MELLERDAEIAAVQALLRRGGVFVVEGGAGIGKTSLLEWACRCAREEGVDVLSARGSELETGFAFGVVRQLFERRIASADARERAELLAGLAAPAGALLLGQAGAEGALDTSFSVVHGVYSLAANLAARGRVLIAVDDAHWADAASQRWLAYLAARVEGLALALLVALRPAEPASTQAPLLALREHATGVARPRLLSSGAVAALVRHALGPRAGDELCELARRASGGNPFYLRELLRALEPDPASLAQVDAVELARRGGEGVAARVAARIRSLDPEALALAQSLAVLGDGCELRHAAAVARLAMESAVHLAAGLVRLDVLASDAPPRFLHPIVRSAVEASLASGERDALRRAAARALDADGAPPGQVAAHLLGVRPAEDPWVLLRLREAAREALTSGAPQAAADLLARALAEPPPRAERIAVLRETARAEAIAGRGTACDRLEEALRLAADPRERSEIALEVAGIYAVLFRWVDAVDVLERALAELGDADPALTARLEAQLVVAGLQDARSAARVLPVLGRPFSDDLEPATAEAFAAARGIAELVTGRPAREIATSLEATLARTGARPANWDTRAALLWVLVLAERFDAVERALEPMLPEVQRTGSARGFVAVYSSLALLKLQLGALPEADAAARVALGVLRESDFAPGLPFAATVLSDIAVEAGQLDEAEALLAMLPQQGWPAGVGTALIPAARGRLRLAQGRTRDALADFEVCRALFGTEAWGIEMRDVAYLHARSWAAQALLSLGERERALALALAELEDARAFAAPRALGIALRVAGLCAGAERGIGLLRESAAALETSPAHLERAHSLAELGAALRRDGQRAAAREPLAEALDLAARCGARPLAARAREELAATGARPRREWRRGVEALTPSELRVTRLAAEGRTNREIASALYVTLKTVEGHLARAYAKLEIAGRRELAAALEGEKTRVGTPARSERRVGDSSARKETEHGSPKR